MEEYRKITITPRAFDEMRQVYLDLLPELAQILGYSQCLPEPAVDIETSDVGWPRINHVNHRFDTEHHLFSVWTYEVYENPRDGRSYGAGLAIVFKGDFGSFHLATNSGCSTVSGVEASYERIPSELFENLLESFQMHEAKAGFWLSPMRSPGHVDPHSSHRTEPST